MALAVTSASKQDGIVSFASVEEWQLLSFFEVEPTLLDPHESWTFNDAAYAIERDELTLTFAITPSSRDVRIVVKRRGSRLYELNALGVRDVRYAKDSRGEWLEIVLSPKETMLLRVKPHIEIEHNIDE